MREEFALVVNLTPTELERWLSTDESRSVADGDGDGEAAGWALGRRVVALQRTRADDLTDDDLDAMREVIGFVRRLRAQPPRKGDVRSSAWRYSLLNRGHDPLR